MIYLHSNNSVDEKQHNDEQGDVGKSLERLYEGPEKRSNAFTPAQQLHQSHDTKETEEVNGNDARRLCNAASIFRLINLGINDINEAPENDDEVENIPSVAKVVFETKSGQFKDKLEGEDGCENHVKHVERIRIELWLAIKLHGEGDCVDHNKDKDCVLERLRCNKPPNFVLNSVLRYVSETRTKTFPSSVFFGTREMRMTESRENKPFTRCKKSHTRKK